MKTFIFVIVTIGLVSCSSIDVQRTAPLGFDTVFIGRVEGSEKVTLEPNESKAGRVLVGLVSAGPIGAIATANTEQGFSNPMAYKYTLSLSSSEHKTVVSRSVVDTGSCVEVVSPDQTSIELLIVVPYSRCESSYNKAVRATGA